MRTHTEEELAQIIEDHAKWMMGEGGSRADLRDAYLSRAYLRRAYLSRAYLRRADLRGADLSGANLSGADLRRADLRGADLSGADLRDADLSRADLSRADLNGADLRGADLRGADLSGADLRRAVHAWAQVSFAGHGECGRMLTAVRYKAGDAITYQCGCFMGTAEELIDYIARGDSRLKATRTRAFEMVNELIQLRNP